MHFFQKYIQNGQRRNWIKNATRLPLVAMLSLHLTKKFFFSKQRQHPKHAQISPHNQKSLCHTKKVTPFSLSLKQSSSFLQNPQKQKQKKQQQCSPPLFVCQSHTHKNHHTRHFIFLFVFLQMPVNEELRHQVVSNLLASILGTSSAPRKRKRTASKSKKGKASAAKKRIKKKSGKKVSSGRKSKSRATLAAQVVEGLLNEQAAAKVSAASSSSSSSSSSSASSSSRKKKVAAPSKWSQLDSDRQHEINRIYAQAVRDASVRQPHIKQAVKLRKRTEVLLSPHNYRLACYLMRQKRAAKVAAASTPAEIAEAKYAALSAKQRYRQIRQGFTDKHLTIPVDDHIYVQNLLARTAATKSFYPASTKAITPYIYFHRQQRPGLLEQNPDANFGRIGKLVGELWRGQSEADKEAAKPGYEAAIKNHNMLREQFDAAVTSYLDSDPEDDEAIGRRLKEYEEASKAAAES